MRLYPLRLIHDNINIDFLKFKKINYLFSCAISVLSILSIIIFGFNFGIDFVGGITIDIKPQTSIEVSTLRAALSNLEIGEVVINESDDDITIKVGGNKSDLNQEAKILVIKDTLNTLYPDNVIEYRKVDFVGPQVGTYLIKSGAYALGLAFLGIMCYIWVRFEWQFGVGVLITLVHDVIISLGFMSITGLDFNLGTIAALLAIIGYSVNDSVVIYDRIRENLRKYTSKSINEIINLSVNETLSRTTMTVLTTLLASASLVLFGGSAIFSFSLLFFVGTIFGTYSSICISSTILTIFKLDRFHSNIKY